MNLDNYRQVLLGKSMEIRHSDGTVETVRGDDFSGALLNSLTVAIPATVIPILIAAFAAYGFAWMTFRAGASFSRWLWRCWSCRCKLPWSPSCGILPVWISTAPFWGSGWLTPASACRWQSSCCYNYISTLPRETLESAFIDGASHFTVFTRLVLPLSVPALAAFAIFQFLWVWNDYLVALIILGPDPNTRVVTMRLAAIVGDRGQDWHLLTSGAFISMAIPLIVFFSLQRYFVRGLLAGSVKGKATVSIRPATIHP